MVGLDGDVDGERRVTAVEVVVYGGGDGRGRR